MNFKRLFVTQAELDAAIYEKHPELVGQYNLDWKVLALQVELAECANEWRGFKKWSKDQEPRVFKRIECDLCAGSGISSKSHPFKRCEGCGGTGKIKSNPLLEEYVDCLHFALTIGLELDVTMDKVYLLEKSEKSLTERFSTLTVAVGLLTVHGVIAKEAYKDIFADVIRLGLKLGFTLEQIEAAYYAKNQINHERQASGY